ncbi:TIGR04283 family arsenosugar biosynthesis glycosyltransferase [Maridesulfovibrio zosterae]|uniref:TIGR04283 family arsenosugar biosynthesis glycosyltransferase n=1 Tax=Maridesulfovibrio zosterae TaxID=82171 RepID=UPI000480111C|nr:TIGR04283 family arsenosugar biosynthesis glycosyltransferase [Maridesulfovibrio zosterae]
MPSKLNISIIIPVFNEQEHIANSISNIKKCCENKCEIIVVDGNINCSTLQEINDSEVIKLHSAKGRASQMNCGAAKASNDSLIFLHADTRLPLNVDKLVHEALSIPTVSAGAFKLSFDSESFVMKFIAYIADMRTRLERVPYGDQAIFVKKDIFLELGGFPQVPLMEDVEFFRKIKKERREIIILDETVKTSARRYLQRGPLRCAVRNICLRILHICGVSTFKLAKMYQSKGR